MNISDDRIQAVRVSKDTLAFDLADGRSVSVPLAWYPTLLHASETERKTFEIQVWSVHWPLLDFDLGAEGLLRGAREVRSYRLRGRSHFGVAKARKPLPA